MDIYRLFLPASTSLGEDSESLERIKKSIADHLRNYVAAKLDEIVE